MSLAHHHHYPPMPSCEGWVSTRVLEEVVLPAYSVWPCEGHGSESSAFHYPGTVPSRCRKALAVFCERQCAAQIGVSYVCCPSPPIPPLNVEVKCGMNIFVYCSDNFGGGYLEFKLLDGQSLHMITPPAHIGGECVFLRGNFSSLIYDLHDHVTPPFVAVATLNSEGPPFPMLRTLSRFSAGELRAVEFIRTSGCHFPSDVQDIHHRFIFIPYVRSMERLRREREIADSIITIGDSSLYF